MSKEEAEYYFSSNEARKAFPTPYAKTNKTTTGKPVYTNTDSGGSCRWWLRSPGINQDLAAYVCNVGSGGGVNSDGRPVDDDGVAVRVALKINLKNL
ncbi:MAG: hypothetical protein J5706_04780 [Elusimicrobiales bacterium]|nr:hypothetical protein [Elusimicrobiales bacterium]